MSKPTKTHFGSFDNFHGFFEQAEKHDAYHVEGVVLDVTNATIQRMQSLGISRKGLASKLGKSQSHVTQLLAGDNNFTLETLVQLALALDCAVNVKLEPIAQKRVDWSPSLAIGSQRLIPTASDVPASYPLAG